MREPDLAVRARMAGPEVRAQPPAKRRRKGVTEIPGSRQHTPHRDPPEDTSRVPSPIEPLLRRRIRHDLGVVPGFDSDVRVDLRIIQPSHRLVRIFDPPWIAWIRGCGFSVDVPSQRRWVVIIGPPAVDIRHSRRWEQRSQAPRLVASLNVGFLMRVSSRPGRLRCRGRKGRAAIV